MALDQLGGEDDRECAQKDSKEAPDPKTNAQEILPVKSDAESGGRGFWCVRLNECSADGYGFRDASTAAITSLGAMTPFLSLMTPFDVPSAKSLSLIEKQCVM